MAYPPRAAFASLLLAAFLVALGYGVLLPVLPGIVAGLDAGAKQSAVIWHTGLVTAAYAGAALIIAPIWGRLSDRLSNSTMIVLSLLLTGIATIAGAFATSLPLLYFWRFVAGAGAGAIGPATQAWLGRWAAGDASWQTRRVVSMGLASNAGLFVGPFVGGLAATVGLGFSARPEVTLQFPFLLVGMMLIAVAAVAGAVVRHAPAQARQGVVVSRLLKRIAPLLAPLSISALAIGAFEVAVAVMAKSEQMSPFRIGLLFAQCTLFMFVAQTVLILPRFRDRSMRPLIVPALAALAAGLTGMAFVDGFAGHTISTALVAGGGGLLSPILAREIAAIDGGASGSASGFQSAASQAGQTAGAVLAAWIAAKSEPMWVFATVALAVAATGVVLAQAKWWMAWKRTMP